ncbi:unnamed protein product, partial [Musa acuminata subsp. burmannicoides]
GRIQEVIQGKNLNNKSVSVVGKAGGDKWKSLSEAEKAPYVAKAAKFKTEYTKKIAAYNKNQVLLSNFWGGSHAAADEDESDKSKSEVNDDDEEEEEARRKRKTMNEENWKQVLLCYLCLLPIFVLPSM